MFFGLIRLAVKFLGRLPGGHDVMKIEVGATKLSLLKLRAKLDQTARFRQAMLLSSILLTWFSSIVVWHAFGFDAVEGLLYSRLAFVIPERNRQILRARRRLYRSTLRASLTSEQKRFVEAGPIWPLFKKTYIDVEDGQTSQLLGVQAPFQAGKSACAHHLAHLSWNERLWWQKLAHHILLPTRPNKVTFIIECDGNNGPLAALDKALGFTNTSDAVLWGPDSTRQRLTAVVFGMRQSFIGAQAPEVTLLFDQIDDSATQAESYLQELPSIHQAGRELDSLRVGVLLRTKKFGDMLGTLNGGSIRTAHYVDEAGMVWPVSEFDKLVKAAGLELKDVKGAPRVPMTVVNKMLRT
jgi:hypothetical protein